jgi:hypothetical protein
MLFLLNCIFICILRLFKVFAYVYLVFHLYQQNMRPISCYSLSSAYVVVAVQITLRDDKMF